MTNKDLINLITVRKSYLDKEGEDDTVDSLTREILATISRGRDELSFEDMFEACTHLGQAPTLLYDDNGHFAVGYTGMQSMSLDPEEDYARENTFDGAWILPPNSWKKTVREALYNYLDRTD